MCAKKNGLWDMQVTLKPEIRIGQCYHDDKNIFYPSTETVGQDLLSRPRQEREIVNLIDIWADASAQSRLNFMYYNESVIFTVLCPQSKKTLNLI